MVWLFAVQCGVLNQTSGITMAGKMECVTIALDRHRIAVEELLAALTSMGQGFGIGLGTGLDAWAKAVLCREWGGIRVTWEEVSKDE